MKTERIPVILMCALLLANTVSAAEVPAGFPTIENIFADEGKETETEPADAATASEAAGKTVTAEGDGFASPDEAVSAYVEAMNAGDVNAMVSTFAVETYIDHLDAAASVERMRSISLANYSSVPVIGSFSRGLLIERRRNEITHLIYTAYLLYATMGTDYESIGTGATEPVTDDASISSYLSVMESALPESWVGHIRITKVCGPYDPLVSKYVPEAFGSENTQKNMDKQLAVCGGEEYAERAAVLDVNGTMGIQFMECIRYGDKWYNWRTNSTIAILLNLNYSCNGLAVGDLGIGIE